MISVCLIVIGIMGQWCEMGSKNILIGDCTEMGRDSHICTVNAESLPAYLSAYDSALCPESPTNGHGDCTHFANGTPVGPEWYGVAMACPIGLVPSQVSIYHVGVFDCIDTGGAIHPNYGEVLVVSAAAAEWVTTWFIVFDVYYQFLCDPVLPECWPDWALMAYSEWEVIYYEMVYTQ